MFKLMIEDHHIDCELDNANAVANVIFDTTGLWMFASHIREVCTNAKSGDRFEYEDVGVVIKCV